MKKTPAKKRKKSTKSAGKKPEVSVVSSFVQDYLHPLFYEGLLIFTLSAGAFLFIALMSYHHSDPGWSHVSSEFVQNAMGKVGAWLADFFLYIFGYLAYVFPLLLVYAALQAYQLRRKKSVASAHRVYLLLLRTLGFAMILSTGCALLATDIHQLFSPLPYEAGGLIGALITQKLVHNFNTFGSNLLMIALLLLGVTLFTGLSWMQLLERFGALCVKSFYQAKSLLARIPWQRLLELPAKFKRSSVVVGNQPLDKPQSVKKSSLVKASPAKPSVSSAPIISHPPSFELDEKMTENLRQSKGLGVMPSLDLQQLGILIELKSVKSTADEDELMTRLEKEAQQALSQINSKNYDSEFKQRGLKQWLKIGLAFSGKFFYAADERC